MLWETTRGGPAQLKPGLLDFFAKETETSTQTVSQAKVASSGELYMSFELGDKKWKLTASDGHCAPSRSNVDAGDTAIVAHCIAKARNRCKLGPQASAHCCYEAGRDGWWLHRWLREQRRR